MGKIKVMDLRQLLGPGAHLSLKVYTYQRNYTYGQIIATKFLFGKFLKRFHLNKEMADIVFNKTVEGGPGHRDTYRVRMRIYEDTLL